MKNTETLLVQLSVSFHFHGIASLITSHLIPQECESTFREEQNQLNAAEVKLHQLSTERDECFIL